MGYRTVYDCGVKCLCTALIDDIILGFFGIYMFLATVTYTPLTRAGCIFPVILSKYPMQVVLLAHGLQICCLVLGWASLLIPIFLFIEAIQVWWPRSFLNRPFRYAAQFFLILVVSSLLYLHWNVPADTLDNAAGELLVMS